MNVFSFENAKISNTIVLFVSVPLIFLFGAVIFKLYRKFARKMRFPSDEQYKYHNGILAR